jgi:hypothetical protein
VKLSYIRPTTHCSPVTNWLIWEAIDETTSVNPTAFANYLRFAPNDQLPTLDGSRC